MDLTDLDAFKQKAATLLADICEPARNLAAGWGIGSGSLVDDPADLEADREKFERARGFRRQLFDAGLGWIEGPPEYGGAGLTHAHQQAYDAVAGAYDVPDHVCFIVGLHIVAPTIEAYGTDEAKDKYLRGLYRGDVIGCQLFSEPDAGSDLAGVKSRAVRDGDGWRVTGQKVWTSGAHFSDVGEMLVRTDPSASKHAGLSMMMIDMHADGVTIRPLKQITGSMEFNEVFLDDVFVPDSDVLGAPGDGWMVANATLGSEREEMGGRDDADSDPSVRLVETAQQRGLTADPVVRQRLAEIVIATRVGRYLANRFHDLGAAGSSSLTGSEAALVKLHTTHRLQAMARLGGQLVGMGSVADAGGWGDYAWGEFALHVPSFRIAGGTDEVMRNVIGERILGLPREPKPNP